MTVQFSNLEEFLGELGKDLSVIDRGILRVTSVFKPSAVAPSVSDVFVVASVSVFGTPLQLKIYAGEYWGNAYSQEPLEKANIVTDQIRRFASDNGLEVRSGLVEGR